MRLVNLAFANAGHRLLLRWISTFLEDFDDGLMKIAHDASFGFANTVKSVRVEEDEDEFNNPSTNEVANVLNRFANLTFLEIEHCDSHFDTPSCLTIDMFTFTNLPGLNHLSISAGGRRGFTRMLERLRSKDSMDEDPEWVAGTAVLKTFSRHEHLSIEWQIESWIPSLESSNTKAMLFIASMAGNVECLKLKNCTLDRSTRDFGLAKNGKLRHFYLSSEVCLSSDIPEHLANAEQCIESLVLHDVRVKRGECLNIAQSLLQFPKLSQVINRCYISKPSFKGDVTKSEVREAFEKLNDHLNAKCRRNNLATCSTLDFIFD